MKLPRHLLPHWLQKYDADRLDCETPVYVLKNKCGTKRWVVKRPRMLSGSRPPEVAALTYHLNRNWVAQPLLVTTNQRLGLRSILQTAKLLKIDLSEVDAVAENVGWSPLTGRPLLFDW